MAEPQDKTGNVKLAIKKDTPKKTPENKNNTTKKTPEKKINTMDIKLYNSQGRKTTMSGACSDREIKAIGRAINHTPDQTIEVK